MRTKSSRKQPNIQQGRFLSANWKTELVLLNRHFILFVCFVYFLYSFNIIYFYIFIVLLLYLAQIFGKRFIQMDELRSVFRTQSNI